MDKRKGLFNKMLVFGIVILLFSVCIVSSNSKIAEDLNLNNQKDILYCDHNGYVLSSGTSCFLYDFILSNPGNVTCVCEEGLDKGYYSFYGATISNENIIYTTEYSTGFLWALEIITCDYI